MTVAFSPETAETGAAGGIHAVLDRLDRAALDNRDKGSQLERLVQAFLRTEPQYAALYDRVWLWGEYPGRGTRADTGVDLVARGRDTGELTAIQCKFVDPSHLTGKGDVDSFLSASGKADSSGGPEFSARLWVSTTDRWGRNAEETIAGQRIPVERLRVQDLDESTIDWTSFSWDAPSVLERLARKDLFDYQEQAVDDVVAGFQAHDRGKLVMACGTGKTFTSLRIAERLVPAGGAVLFLVPSIALLSQTLREWAAQAVSPLRCLAVCSDVSAGKRRTEEDITVTDLAFPATTDPAALARRFSAGGNPEGLTVVFSTYQSLDVVAQAQRLGVPEFGLVVADEAHRTTGVTLAGQDESAFVRIHDPQYVRAARRLYMTATPRIFTDGTRKKADEAGAVLADMGDEAVFGPEFHRLGFGKAVSMGRLTDYKVLVLAVDEGAVAERFQQTMAGAGYELNLEDTAKIVGCWNGMAKRSVIPGEYDDDPSPARRAVMFARDIATSKMLADTFQQVVDGELGKLAQAGHDTTGMLRAQAQHVDGTQSMLARNAMLDWLKAPTPPDTARLLSNARCLAEGVDVPALDAVLFMNPRKSVVDVVQSVGRVMRKSPGKRFGYVILPIAVPAGIAPEEALSDNARYRVVWQVLQALRAHDERFDAEVNKIDLTGKTDRLMVDVIGAPGHDRDDDDGGEGPGSDAQRLRERVQLDFTRIQEWRDAILSKIVQKVGQRRYWETWAGDVAEIARAHTARITALLDGDSQAVKAEFEAFTEGLRLNLNPEVGREDAVEMLSQHLITQPVFDALFSGYRFTASNPVSQVMDAMAAVLDGENLSAETRRLEDFYDSVRLRAAGIQDDAARQGIVKELYEKFFATAFTRTSEKLGIVYTPTQIVDFINRSVNDILHDEFGATLSDAGVHILDPFTGTGTFIVRLLQTGLIRPQDLARKYRHELHANEIVLLAYYVAAINIEQAYHALRGGEYVPFDGIVLTDTFQMFEDDDKMDDLGVFQANNDRVIAQKSQDIRVIVGNPPWSTGQRSGNDDNRNNPYPTLDRHIRDTYAARSTATNKNNLYDSYIRAIRWASDRIGPKGVVAYVSNGGYIDSNTADGLRLTLLDEFTSVYVFNLRGNQRTAGEKSRREGGKIFGSGSRATVAILILVKNPDKATPGVLHYHDIGDYLTRDQKLDAVEAFASMAGVPWTRVTPSPQGDWTGQRSDAFASYTPIGEKDPAKKHETRIFDVFSRGLETGRDAWVYNYSRTALEDNVRRLADNYNAEIDRWTAAGRPLPVEKFVNRDEKRVKWTSTLFADLRREMRSTTRHPNVRVAMYRPFSKLHASFDEQFIHRRGQLASAFPLENSENIGIVVTGVGASMEASALITRSMADLSVFGAQTNAQFFPRYTYREAKFDPAALDGLDVIGSPHYERVDNITDAILADYRRTFGATVAKDDIFYYVYGLLHSPAYRAEFEADLRKALPHIPKTKEFRRFADAGRQLAALHLGYEDADPWPLEIIERPGASLRVAKMRYPGRGDDEDKTTILYNDDITIIGIPPQAHRYTLGSRSALDWILERYRVKTDKASGIPNDPNAWGEEHDNPRYILDLIRRITTVSVRTVEIVDGLPNPVAVG